MRRSTPLPFLMAFMVISLGPLSAQVLEGRTSPAQLQLVRTAVLDGRLPPYDTWPQPAKAPQGEEEKVTGGSDFEGILGVAARWNNQAFWDQYLFEPGDKNAFGRWTVHAEAKEHWGFVLHSDLYDRTPGWHATTLLWPSATSAVPLESHFLTKSYLWYDFKPLQIQIGRDQVHFGPLDHSLVLSDAVPFLDMIRGSITGGPWTLDWIVATPETRTQGGGTDVQDFVLLNTHRIEYRTDTWMWAMSENYIVHRLNNGPLYLADIVPIGITHQLDMNPNNNCLLFDGQWVVAPGYRVMGQFGFDDIDGRVLGLPDNPVPTIWAFLLGTEWQGELADGATRLYGEVGMTHYLWGNFGDPVARAQYLIVLDQRTESMPLTSPYGPGTAWVNFSSRWTQGILTLGGKLELFVTKEGVDLSTPYAYNWGLEGFGSSPSERLSLLAQWQLSPDLATRIEPAQYFHAGQATLEAKFTLDWTP